MKWLGRRSETLQSILVGHPPAEEPRTVDRCD